MKRIFSAIIASAFVLALGFSFTACDDDIPEVIDELSLGRCYTPTNLSYKITEGEYVTFSWDCAATTANFVLELSFDSDFSSIEETFTLDPDEVPYYTRLEVDVTYYWRVKGQNEGVCDDSNWAVYDGKVTTYAVKDNAYPVVSERTSSSISVTWTPVDDDDEEFTHIVATPTDTDSHETVTLEITDDMIAASEATVDGLDPSTQYILGLWYSSANRGEVSAWTRPDVDATVTIASLEDTALLRQTITDAAGASSPVTILVTYMDGNIVMNTIDVAGPIAIYGQEDADGTKPTIAANFKLADGTTSIHFEGLAFYGYGDSGQMSQHIVLGSTLTDIDYVEVINCDLDSFKSGVIYENYACNIGDILYDGCYISDFAGSGGDMFDIRNTDVIESFTIKNSTITNGSRTFIRMDSGVSVDEINISNNTINDICYGSSNNKGFFYIRGTVNNSFVFDNNLILNITDDDTYSSFIQSDAYAMPTEVKNNFYYNLSSLFWWKPTQTAEDDGSYSADDVICADAYADATILDEDPCESSEDANFYVTSSDVIDAAAGDPRWLTTYIEQEEDLTLEVTEATYTWDLTDTKTFKSAASKDQVRGGIRFYVTSNPINFLTNGFEFSAAATLSDGVPTDCGIGFKVAEPGSVFYSVEQSESGSASNTLIVSLDGTPAGAAIPGSENVQVAFPDIVEGEEHMVYIYAVGGPAVLSSLQWSDNYETSGATQLSTPVVTLSTSTIDEDTFASTDITVSWDAVSNAGSYAVNIGSSSTTTTSTSYTISAGSLDPNIYYVTVQALIASDDLARSNSELSDSLELYITEVQTTVSSTKTTAWDGDDWSEGIARYDQTSHDTNTESVGSAKLTEDYVLNNLAYSSASGSGNSTLGTDDNGYTYISVGGSGSLSSGKNLLQIKVAGPGTLRLSPQSSGTSERVAYVAINSTRVESFEGAAPVKGSAIDTLTLDLTSESISEGDIINIYSKSSQINFYYIEWTPYVDENSSSDGIPSDEDAIEEYEELDIAGTTTVTDSDGNTVTLTAGTTNDFTTTYYSGKYTLAGGGSKLTWDLSSNRIKYNGASTVGDDGIPTTRYISFKITTPGTITHKFISGSSSDATRVGKVILVTVEDGANVVTTLYDTAAPTSSSADAVETAVTSDHLANTTTTATVYLYAEANVNLYALSYNPSN